MLGFFEIFAENNCLWIHGLEMDAVSFNTYEAVIQCLLAVHSEPMRRSFNTYGKTGSGARADYKRRLFRVLKVVIRNRQSAPV